MVSTNLFPLFVIKVVKFCISAKSCVFVTVTTVSCVLTFGMDKSHCWSNILLNLWYIYYICIIKAALTDTNRWFSRPAVILLTYPNWNANESEPRVTLVNHAAPVIIVLTNYLPINYGVRRATVPSWGEKQVNIKKRDDFESHII